MENKFQNLFDSVSQKIENYNFRISSGERLNPEDSEDFSKALKLLPTLSQNQEIFRDLEFAKSDTSFDTSFVSDLENKLTKSNHDLQDLITQLSKEEINEFIIEMRAGAGGEEASLFVRDLFTAYTRFLNNHNFKYEVIEMSEADAGGYSTIIFEVRSSEAYEMLRNEGGVHRVQRVPKTESSGRIQTSTISIALLPIHKKSTVEINPNDLIIDVYRSSGNGGQSVNTTDSAVRITHIPSGLVVTCQNTKSQIKNKEMALKVLEARLEEIQRNADNKNIQDLRNKQILGSERAEKIRTYNYLQDRITDHRAKLDFSNIQKFMQGEFENALTEINKVLAVEDVEI